MKNYIEKLVLATALTIIFSLGFFSIINKSMIWDERCYIGAGKYILKTGNFEYNIFRAHPPLSFYINSIFLLPLKFDDKMYSSDDCWQTGYDMAYHSGYSPKLILILARLPFIIMSMILALYVFYWSRQLYGVKSGFMALALYTFSTSIISQSNLALTDFTATFFIFITMYHYWKFWALKQKKHMYLASIFFGLSLLSKLTGMVLIPILIILTLYGAFNGRKNIKDLSSNIKTLLTIFIIGFLVMFLAFGFQFKPLKSVMPSHYAERAYEEFGNKFENEKIRNLAVYAFEKIPLPFPAYFFGLGAVGFTSKEGILKIFLDGDVFSKSPWYYPPAVLFYKTQASLFLLLILSIIFFKKIKSGNISDEYIQIMPMMLVFVLFMLNNMTVGLRHILPIYPFMFLFISKIARLKNVLTNIAILILMMHYVVSSLLIFPHYFAYFNEFAGGPANGYKHLVGANIDNGQDLPGLKKFMEDHNLQKINLSYLGSIDPKEYVNYDYLPSPYFQHWVPDYKPYVTVTKRNEDCSEKKGWVAISITNLQNVYMVNETCFNWLKKYEPVTKIGYSIFVYYIPKNY
mgnify:CR=1 FL=1